MAKSTTNQNGALPRAMTTTPQWMSLKDASELTGLGRAELRTRISAGELAARTIRRGDKVEHRLTRAALAEAGLIGGTPPQPAMSPISADPTPATAPPPESAGDPTMAQLIALIREQNQRIASLEDQRAQLAARLGATVEAMHQLEDRLEVILDARAAPPTPIPAVDAPPITTDDGLVLSPETGQPANLATDNQSAPRPTQTAHLLGVRRSLSRLVREVAQPRLRELAGGPRREVAPGD
jgi:hypothetical protein